jgi:hypothetical protein
MKSNSNIKNQSFWHNISSVLYLLLVGGATYYLNSEGKFMRDISWIDFTLLFLATFRIIRLLTYDKITQHIRVYLRRFDNGVGKELALLLDCPWCTGIWAGLLVAFIFFLNPIFYFFILALAISGMGSFVQIVIWKIGLEPK